MDARSKVLFCRALYEHLWIKTLPNKQDKNKNEMFAHQIAEEEGPWSLNVLSHYHP